jgi:soluble cytochrome b562
MTMQTTLIPRTALKATLQGLRRPISGIEVLTGQRGNDNWPPALAFEDFEAGVKQFVGLVLGDAELVDEGRIQQAKVTELRRAGELDAQADQARATADSTLKATRNRAEDERREAELKAREREDAIHRDLRAAQQHANGDLDKKAAVVDRAARTSDKRVAATKRQAALTRVNQQSAAVKQQRRAVTATRTARERARALEVKKAQRKSK